MRTRGIEMLINSDDENVKKYADNGMLNKPGFHSTGSFSYNIEIPLDKITEKRTYIGYVESSFDISGCGRDHVSLSFDITSEEEFENSLFKLNTLMNAIQQFKTDMVDAKRIVDGRKEEVETIKRLVKEKKEKEKKKP